MVRRNDHMPDYLVGITDFTMFTDDVDTPYHFKQPSAWNFTVI